MGSSHMGICSGGPSKLILELVRNTTTQVGTEDLEDGLFSLGAEMTSASVDTCTTYLYLPLSGVAGFTGR